MGIPGEVEALNVADEDFLVASMIDRCPKAMMLRELVKNALEAAEKAIEGIKLVRIEATVINGVSKLAIWNTGPGMSDVELHNMCNIAASIGKEKGLDANFGMGAKVASLPSNQLGLRYRSARNGVVSEVILGKRKEVYGRLNRYDAGGEFLGQVVDVTDIAAEDGHDLSIDWTEVVLLGNRDDQDTVSDPFNADPKVDRNWIGTYLYHRFFRVNPEVEVRLHDSVHSLDGTRSFEPIVRREGRFARTESIRAEGGILIHYLYDEPYAKSLGHNRSSVGSVSSGVSVCSIVYRGEMYDVRKQQRWFYDAAIFGVPFGARHISIHIEIPGDFPVLPDGYRQFLRYTDGDQSHVAVEDFAGLVRDNRPDWLREIIRSFAPQTGGSNDDIRSELQRLLDDLRVTTETPRVELAGQIAVDVGAGRVATTIVTGSGGGGGDRSAALTRSDLSVAASGTRKARMTENQERAPEIIELEDDQEIADKGLTGRAARYLIETGQLFVNLKYPAIADLEDLLAKEYAHVEEAELMRQTALDLARHTVKMQIGRHVVFGLAKRRNKEWDHEDMLRALGPESLSVAADNYLDALYSVRKKMSKALKTIASKSEETELEVA